MSRGRRVILCMGRMRKEIMGRFLQSGWPSILVSTSLKTEFLDLQERSEGDCVFRMRERKEDKMSGRHGAAFKVDGSNPGGIRKEFVCICSATHTSRCSVLCW